MEELSNKTPSELLTIVEDTDDKEVLRFIANELDLTFSGNTGVGTLKEKLIPILQEKSEPEPELDKDDPIVKALEASKQAEKINAEPEKAKNILELPRSVLANLNPNVGKTIAEKRAIVRASAMRLHHVRIHNLDPNDSALPGAIKTVYNKYCGKVSKYIPFGEENEVGYHVPEILLNSLREEKYTLRKEIKQRGQVSNFGVKQYKTVLMPKFNIENLTPLSESEIESLAKDQKARGAIDVSD